MENQRIRLSKTMLKNALFTLLKEKPLDQITVYELFALPCVHNIFQFIHEPEHASATKRKYLQTCISHGLFAVLSSWLQNDHPESVSEIKEVFSSFRTSFLQIN